MKKYVLSFALTLALTLGFSFLSNGQNLVINGDLESWTAGEPDGWDLIENISQESTTVHGDIYSAKHTSHDDGAQYFRQNISGIQAGQEYTISYWYYDNDPEAKTRIWSYWLSGTSTLPDNGEILRPSEYSENNADWQQFNEVLTAPAAADGFRFEVRVYHQDNLVGGSVFYDDFLVSGDIVVDPEPSNYPTDFEAIASVNLPAIDLFWSDAIGTQLPDAYLIFAGTGPTLPVPVDGTPVPDDTDLSDGSGALNISYGMEECSFGNLDPNTTYYFSIYSYTNSGTNIDYKNDGTAPTANATSLNITTINFEDFEDGTLGTWWQFSVASDQDWINGEYGGNKFAKANGYGANEPSDDWLISPPLNLDDYTNEILTFETAKGFNDVIEGLEIKISEDYSGSGNPYLANWTVLTATLSTGNYEWTPSGDVDISLYNGPSVYISFHYMSTGTGPDEAALWEVDNIVIIGEEVGTIDPEPSNYPTGFEANASGTSIDLSWTDAIGTQLPGAYIIFAGTSASLPTPTDGTPVPNDTDLSDGSGALNVVYGLEEAMFSDLVQGTTYYFSIYPYTNNGINIDYKNDGTAPTANEIIPTTPEPTNYPTNFTADATSSEINLTWTDATGTQLPEAYIIFAGTSASLPTPTDGTPVADDTDLSDGSGALNVLYGLEEAMFSELVQGTTYYFSIYPYTNSGTNIDYKNDGVAPTVEATTSSSTNTIINMEDFEDGTLGTWWQYSVASDHDWINDEYGGNKFAKANGYGADEPSDDWLISPPLNLDDYTNEILNFETAKNFEDVIEGLEIKISEDYSGSGDPYLASWTVLTATLSTGGYEWTLSGDVDISLYNGSAVYIAFHYMSTGTVVNECTTWEVDNIVIEGEEGMSSDDQFTMDGLFIVYPNPTTGLLYIEKPGMVITNINIMSVTGNLVKSVVPGTELTKVDLTDMSKGIYIIMFRNNETGQTFTHKLILQ